MLVDIIILIITIYFTSLHPNNNITINAILQYYYFNIVVVIAKRTLKYNNIILWNNIILYKRVRRILNRAISYNYIVYYYLINGWSIYTS